MQINILNINKAGEAIGLTVIIDVFRAFTTACYVIANGARKIIPVGKIESAYELKRKNPEYVLMGERGGVIQEGFDYGNSPYLVSEVDFSGKIVVMTTSHGTQGLVNTKNVDEIITGSFVNAGAVINYIKNKNPEIVSLICTSVADEHILDEDAQCAYYIKNTLEGKKNDFNKIMEHLHKHGFTDYFFDPKRESHPREDFYCSMALDKFYFILKLVKENKISYLNKTEI